MTTIEKTVSIEIKKWSSFNMDIYFLNNKIFNCYCKISLGDYDNKKKSFIRMHYLKMLKHYIYIKIYHCNIKKLSSNEKLICYFEPILVANGFDISKW